MKGFTFLNFFMKNYERPQVFCQEDLNKGVYLASGDGSDDTSAEVCKSIYIQGTWHKPNHGAYQGTNLEIRGCEGCPADSGSFCTLTKGYKTGDKDYRPTWERNGERSDKKTSQKGFFLFLSGRSFKIVQGE